MTSYAVGDQQRLCGLSEFLLRCAGSEILRAKYCSAHSISTSRHIDAPFLFHHSDFYAKPPAKKGADHQRKPKRVTGIFIPAPKRTSTTSPPFLLLNYPANIASKVLRLRISASRQTVVDLWPLDLKRWWLYPLYLIRLTVGAICAAIK